MTARDLLGRSKPTPSPRSNLPVAQATTGEGLPSPQVSSQLQEYTPTHESNNSVSTTPVRTAVTARNIESACGQTQKIPIKRCSCEHETPVGCQNDKSGFGDCLRPTCMLIRNRILGEHRPSLMRARLCAPHVYRGGPTQSSAVGDYRTGLGLWLFLHDRSPPGSFFVQRISLCMFCRIRFPLALALALALVLPLQRVVSPDAESVQTPNRRQEALITA